MKSSSAAKIFRMWASSANATQFQALHFHDLALVFESYGEIPVNSTILKMWTLEEGLIEYNKTHEEQLS